MRFQAISRAKKLKSFETRFLAWLLLINTSDIRFIHGCMKMTRITNNIFDSIEVALKAENLRQKAIASNIANLETPRYRSVDVKFEDMLDKAMQQASKGGTGDVKAELYQPCTTSVNEKGNDVDLEAEIVKMIKNTLRHKAYVRILNKKYQQMQLAVKI